MSNPRVSIICATYNRSNVLSYAIQSVLWQTMEEWELIVVGDACTDNTAEVVAFFNDSRIRFHNLTINVGEQSGPNNEGGRLACGRYVAYLNHDDLWLPRHLEWAVQALETNTADLVFSLMGIVRRDGPNVLGCATPTGRYEPDIGVPASAWVFRRELLGEIGPWSFYRDCRLSPSQDWLRRARHAGKELRLVPRVSVIAIQSGSRPGSYANREEEEHRDYFNNIQGDPDFVEKELTSMLMAAAPGQVATGANFMIRPFLVRAAKNTVRLLLHKLGLDLGVVISYLQHPRKGSGIDRLRQVRGLPPLDRSKRRTQ